MDVRFKSTASGVQHMRNRFYTKPRAQSLRVRWVWTAFSLTMFY